MFPGASDRTRLIKVCEDCRVVAALEGHIAAHPSANRAVRITDDYHARAVARTLSDEAAR
jgi:hypothetical protein